MLLLKRRYIYLYDFMPQAIKIIANIQYLGTNFLGELPSAEESHLTQLNFFPGLDYISRWIDGVGVGGMGVRKWDVKSWPPHLQLGKLWSAILVSVLARVWADTSVLTSLCSVLFQPLFPSAADPHILPTRTLPAHQPPSQRLLSRETCCCCCKSGIYDTSEWNLDRYLKFSFYFLLTFYSYLLFKTKLHNWVRVQALHLNPSSST